jgi:hypothetical protein
VKGAQNARDECRARSRPSIVKEGRTLVVVGFLLPPGAAGGAPTVIIDKRSRRVVDAFGEQ